MSRVWVKCVDSTIIALIPLLYIVINPSFGQNLPGDIDTWFYFGLAKEFWHLNGPDFPLDYYETRLPYIIPAALAFSIPSDRLGSWILSYLVYCASALSLLYVLRSNVPRPAAFLATILMVSDIYLMRTMGWQYVDGGVLAYGSLTFAALTAAAMTRYRHGFAALSGFLFLSMLIVHLGSVPLALAVAGYAFVRLSANRIREQEYLVLALSFCSGALACQVIYGLLNSLLFRAGFLFEIQQVAAGVTAYSVPEYFTPLDELFTDGRWLTVHMAMWVASGIMLIAWLTRAYSPTKFQLYCMSTVFVLYLILFILDYFKLSIFLARDGLYVSFYFFLSYLFVGSMIPKSIEHLSAAIVGGVFLLALALRFYFGEAVADYLPPTPVWAVAIALGAIIAVATLTKKAVVQVLLALIAVAILLPVRPVFWHEDAIYTARDAISRINGADLPYFAFSSTDPIYVPVLIGLVGSFTPRAWWLACRSFPDCPQHLSEKRMIVVSSNADPSQVARMASSVAPAAILSGAIQISRPEGDFSIYNFDIPR